MGKERGAAANSPDNYEGLTKAAAIKQERRPITELNPAVYNPRKRLSPGDDEYESLKRSIEVFGYVDPIIINSDGTVIGGHQRLNVLLDLGYTEVDVAVVNLSKNDEKALNIALNKISGEWDNDKLAALFSELDVEGYLLENTGFQRDELAELNISLRLDDTDKEEADEEVPDPPLVPVSREGDVWNIGRHRLMCGNSTEKEIIESLLDGAEVDLVMTDPPYGINAEKMTMGSGKKDFHRGEGWDSERPDISIAFDIAPLVCIWGGNYFADRLPVTNDWLCWWKKNDGLSFSEFELAWTNFGRNCRHIAHHWGSEKKLHITMKPLEVIAWAIQQTKEKCETVVDLFGGSGSTLIACERLDRTCYMVELDPKYCDVIVRRYMQVTGKRDIVLLRDGEEIPVSKTGILND